MGCVCDAKQETLPSASINGEIGYTPLAFWDGLVISGRKLVAKKKPCRVTEFINLFDFKSSFLHHFSVSKPTTCFETQPLFLCFSQGC